ncbi:hypothetical protein [Cryobacterium frigoriphilum]|nr:hypothetical protein [Cryobacterium frigoriphilum]
MTTQLDVGIPEAQLQTIIDGLSRVLADSYTVYLKTHNYHWNVVGPMFHSLTDLLVRRLDVHEKTAWMLRSMIAGTH